MLQRHAGAICVKLTKTPAKEHITRMKVISAVIDVRIVRSFSDVDRFAQRMSPGSGAYRQELVRST